MLLKKKVDKKPLFKKKKIEEQPTKPKFTNIRDIVDKTRPYSMIYSGVESTDYFHTLYDLGIRNFLMSYHYIQTKSLPLKSYRDLGVKFFIDSGAFTYKGNEEFYDKPLEFWERHIVNYLSWARANKDIIFAIANLDIEVLVGTDKVLEWNEKYFEPFMLETGIPVCFIWHEETGGMNMWEFYCKRYPYTGISWVSGEDTMQENYGRKLLDVAAKYNTLVHGMGMTRTSLLPKLPFYTSDSTTYLVGVQYGEVNFWRGTKMSRLKKDKWKGEYLSQILSLGNLDRQKLLDEEPLEMIKANVLAFIEAEKYIQTRLRTRMYWLRQEAVINKGIHSTEDYLHLLPTSDWVRDREESNWEEYCRNLNINVENKEIALLNLEDMTIVSNWYNPEFEDLLFTSSDLKKVHDKWINKVVPDDDTRVEDLQNFYLEVVMGRDDSMLKDGSAFTIQAQERDDYIEEDYEELVEIDEKEILNSVKNLLPTPSDTEHAPDIEGLDDEIFKERGITVIRDSKGRIVKGSKSMRKSKKIYSEKFPKLLCDTCHAAQGCQHYKAGFVCAFTKLFKKFSTRNKEDVLDALHGMAEMNMERLQRAAFFELVDGGLPTNMVTNLINQNMNLLMTVKSIDEQELHISQTKTTTYKSDGTLQETTSVNATGGGILEQLFANTLKSRGDKKDEDDLKDVEIVID